MLSVFQCHPVKAVRRLSVFFIHWRSRLPFFLSFFFMFLDFTHSHHRTSSSIALRQCVRLQAVSIHFNFTRVAQSFRLVGARAARVSVVRVSLFSLLPCHSFFFLFYYFSFFFLFTPLFLKNVTRRGSYNCFTCWKQLCFRTLPNGDWRQLLKLVASGRSEMWKVYWDGRYEHRKQWNLQYTQEKESCWVCAGKKAFLIDHFFIVHESQWCSF